MLTVENFIEKITDILDSEDEVTMDSVLEDIEEWDSLSLVSYIAMANSSYGKKIDASEIRKAVTVRDLYNLVR